jgi:GAF domain-containing protein
MLELVQQLNRVRYTYDTADEKQRANLQLVLANIICGVISVFLAITVILNVTDTTDVSWTLFGILVIGLMFAPVVHYLVQTGYQEISGYLMVLGITVLYLFGFFAAPSAENVSILGFIIPVLCAALLLNVRVMLVVAAVFVGAYTVSVGLQIVNESFPDRIATHDYSIQVTQSFLVMLIVAVVLLNQYVRGSSRIALENAHTDRLVQSVAEIVRQIARTSVKDSFYKKIVEVIRDSFDLHSVHLFSKTSSEQFELLAATGLIGLRLVSEGRRLDVTRESTAGLAYRQKIAVRTSMQSPLHQRVDFLLATQSELVVPLLSAEHEVIGLLVLYSEEDGAFTQQEVALLETISSELALIFEQNRLQRRIRSLEQHLQDNQRQHDDLQAELDRLRQEVEGHVWDDYLSLRHKAAGFEWDGDKAVAWHNDELPLTHVPYIENLKDGRKRIAIPIIFGSDSYGDMIFEAGEEVAWSQRTLELATAVANRLALALDNARLFDQAQTIALREQLVSSVSSELQDARNMELLVNRAATLFNRVLGAEQTHVRMRVARQTENADAETH